MKQKLLLLLTLSAFLGFQSCKKSEDPLNSSDIKKLTDIKVPEGFLWESSRDVSFKVNVSDTRFSNASHIIAIYTPDNKLLSKGAATINQAFETKIYLPTGLKEVYIIKTAPDNSTVFQKVALNATDISVNLGPSSNSALASAKNTSTALAVTSPDCTTGCTQSINLTSDNQWITVEAGRTVCVNGSNKTFNATFGTGGGTLRVCGSDLTIQNINRNNNDAAIGVVITFGSSVNVPGINFDRANQTFNIFGTCTVTGNLASSGTVNNYGNLTVNNDYNLNSSNITHTNSNSLTVKGTMNVNSTTTFENTGTASVKTLQINSNGIFNNQCKLSITENLMNNKTLNNYSYVQVAGNTQINGGAFVNLFNGAYFKTKDLDKITGLFVGTGTASLVSITGTVNNNLILDANQTTTGQKFKGTLQVCHPSSLPTGLFKDGAATGCDLYIASTGCNPGNGSAPVTDSDGDGISDNQDEYPNDATKAFNNYYPSNDSDAGSTIAFEDMWPVKGDYDMNDVVFSYKLKIVTNASNKVVQVDGTYNLHARGGIYQNGFGIEFPVSRSLVSDVSGGTLEEGQSKAVITLFENTHAEMLLYNTRLDEPFQPSKAYAISFKISNGPSLNNFGLGEYNPFIWNKASGRGFEIHLPGKTPTTLANTSLFGTGDDRSNAGTGKYYATAEGYPWAISVPLKNFVYPIEGKDIITAYLKLPQWISSGGTLYTDWYSNTGTGYRNTVNLFAK